jgi:hypothetical protein
MADLHRHFQSTVALGVQLPTIEQATWSKGGAVSVFAQNHYSAGTAQWGPLVTGRTNQDGDLHHKSRSSRHV